MADVCEFLIDYSKISADVIPSQPSDWYFNYEAEDGKVYVDFCIAYKNLKAADAGAADVILAELTYAGKYEHEGFSMIEKIAAETVIAELQ